MPKSGRVYADNPQNRALGRVGKPFGSAPVTTRSKGKPDGGEDGSGLGNFGKKTGKQKSLKMDEEEVHVPFDGTKPFPENEIIRLCQEGRTVRIGDVVIRPVASDLGPGPSSTGYRTGDTRRMNGEVLSVEEVDRRLQALGVPLTRLKQKGAMGYGEPIPKTFPVSKCVRAAIQQGFIELKGEDKRELNQIIAKIKFTDGCGHKKDVRLCDVLYQPDYGGHDYEVGLQDATVICEEPGCQDDGDGFNRVYLAEICTGEPGPNCGKFFNHCGKCPGFGYCIGDYREAHCNKCNDHFYAVCNTCPCGGGGRMQRFGGFF